MIDPFPLWFVIKGPPCSYKNSKQVVRFGGTTTVQPSKAAQRWMKFAIRQLEQQWVYKPLPASLKLTARILVYLPTKALTDLDNLLGGPCDALQQAGVLEDDVCICSFDGSRRLYDKGNGRVEISLARFDDSAPVELEQDPDRVEVDF